MNRSKSPLISIISATVFIFIIVAICVLLIPIYSSRYGAISEEAARLAVERLVGITTIILLINTIVLSVLSFSKIKVAKPLNVICGIISGGVCFALCYNLSKFPFFSTDPGIQSIGTSAIRTLTFVFGLAFPVLHITLNIHIFGNSVKDALRNQGLTFLLFLVLSAIFVFFIGFLSIDPFKTITISICLASFVIIFPSLNINQIVR